MIEVRDIYKRFGERHVLNGVSFSAQAGEVTAIVGPNGSGKSTMIKCILGLAKADSGSIHVYGAKLNGTPEYRRSIGYMPQTPRFPENLTGSDALKLMSKLRTGSGEFSREAWPFSLEHELTSKARTLSGGERQKLNASLALMFNPDALIMDEPTASLDPASSRTLKRRITEEKERGRTIILTSHIITEVEELADKVVFILSGRVRFSGSINDLLRQTSEANLEAALANLMNGNGQG